MSASNDKNTPEVCTFAYFLESVPPGSKWAISDLFHRRYTGIVLLPQRPSAASAPSWSLNTPDIWLHCPTKKCSGDRAFACLDDVSDVRGYQQMNIFLVYSCRNCSKSTKTYSLRVTAEGEGSDSAVKYGEMPAFGPPLPARLLNMVGADGALLRKGRQTENQSLGIGAFAYYRRVVENQKNRLLERHPQGGGAPRCRRRTAKQHRPCNEGGTIQRGSQAGERCDPGRPEGGWAQPAHAAARCP